MRLQLLGAVKLFVANFTFLVATLHVIEDILHLFCPVDSTGICALRLQDISSIIMGFLHSSDEQSVGTFRSWLGRHTSRDRQSDVRPLPPRNILTQILAEIDGLILMFELIPSSQGDGVDF